MSRAIRLCPNLILVSWHRGDYSAVSKKVMAILHDLTPLVEQISIDEAFMDVTDLPDSGETLARNLQARIHQELDLPCSLGVASNKLVAKIANSVGKSAVKTGSYPNAISVVAAGEEAAFLAPLPTQELWGVGPKTAERLAVLGILTIGDIAAYPPEELARLFGKHGEDLARHARGIDDRPIVTERETKSISREITYTHDVRDEKVLHDTLREMCEEVAEALRHEALLGRTVQIKLRWTDFTTMTRQVTLREPTDQAEVIFEQALQLLRTHRPPNRYVRLLGVGVSGLMEELPIRQLGLWEGE
jgi:DNA polymerase-4